MKMTYYALFSLLAVLLVTAAGPAQAWFGTGKFEKVKPENGVVSLPLKEISDGKAHYYRVKSDKGIMVTFFVVKSPDGVIRAAVDACDVCYRSGKGYVQEGGTMVCTNCGMRFATDRINEVKGGCNPAPLARTVNNDQLLIAMSEINASAWLCEFKK
ncbi:DUF2318 domain-containing protein [Desulfotignum phosphitoxidans]|jgi:uncharacterized membrane protein|uniref:Membrane iron-sulfur containing protein FtrD-like domain-containing protein n=1 Tax=Desulfotignum phosphitoxidans DSM 13687 TaxID=1286635 RepID=S0FZ99_9BACT|nr:DUF2318 domain-containing protein [Desulfotignum phosphitoxidans]EMS78544.1 hypothetical protein DUF2318 [Desulfotignum phosphitoxidans DSM 13687]